MGLEIKYKDGQTPLSEEEMEGLLIDTITTHVELDEFEQKATKKTTEKKPTVTTPTKRSSTTKTKATSQAKLD